jgi:hypothetical protein
MSRSSAREKIHRHDLHVAEMSRGRQPPNFLWRELIRSNVLSADFPPQNPALPRDEKKSGFSPFLCGHGLI